MGIQTQEKLLQECYLMVMSFLKEKKLGILWHWVFFILEDFWEPVKWQELGLYDYLEKIKTPMDLTTMKVPLHCILQHRINSNQTNTEIFLSLLLICDSCGRIV